MLQFRLDNKVILISGASSGIGRQIAISCAEAGARCILVARNAERLKEVCAQCKGDGHVIEVLDVTNVNAMREMVDRLPQLDGVVQCAGVGDRHTPLKFLTEEFVDEILGVNLKAPILMLAMLDKKKKINKCGSVVMMSSIASFHATVAHSLYGATKGGIKSFVQGAALDLAGKKIRVNAIAPGMVNTPLINFSALTEEQLKTNANKYPLKRYGEPIDVAGAALYLLSDASVWVTGQQFVIDGGITIGG